MEPTYYFFITIGVMTVLLAVLMRLRSRVRRMEENLFTPTIRGDGKTSQTNRLHYKHHH